MKVLPLSSFNNSNRPFAAKPSRDLLSYNYGLPLEEWQKWKRHIKKLKWPSLRSLAGKVTVNLHGCLAYKRCSASGLNCRYLNPSINLKLIGLAIRLYQQFWKEMNCRIFHDFYKCERANHLLDITCMSERILYFA